MLFDGEETKLLIANDLNLLREILLIGDFCYWVGFPPIPWVSHEGSGEGGGTVDTWWVQQFFDILVKKGDTWRMILGDNPAGHCFVLRDLVLIDFLK